MNILARAKDKKAIPLGFSKFHLKQLMELIHFSLKGVFLLKNIKFDFLKL